MVPTKDLEMRKVLTLIGLTILLSSCTLEDGKMFDSAYDFYGLPKAESDPVVTENPKKHQKYELTVTMITTNRTAGATAYAVYQPEFSLKKISDTVYQGEFYTDRPLNEDYFGQGVCLWENIGISLGFKADNNKKSTYFSANIDDTVWKNLTKKGATAKLVYYHRKADYPIATWFDSETGLPAAGITAEQAQQRNIDLKDTFSIELEIRRI